MTENEDVDPAFEAAYHTARMWLAGVMVGLGEIAEAKALLKQALKGDPRLRATAEGDLDLSSILIDALTDP